MQEILHPLTGSMLRGAAGRCPACGHGRLFWRYLQVSERCPVCAHDLARYPADDGPAYFTILLIGHLIVVPVLFFPIVWRSSPVVTAPIVLAVLAAVTLTVLPRIKGAFIGLLYALGVKDTD